MFEQLLTLENRKSKTLLLVDLNNILHKSIAVHSYLHTYYKDRRRYTGGLYGVTHQINAVLKKESVSRIVICDDQPPYIRTSLYSGYKSDRKRNSGISDKMADSKKLISYFFKRLNIPIWKQKGYEADDLIACLCTHCFTSYDKILILSNDKDLYSLLSNYKVAICTKGKNYTESDFIKEYNLPDASLWGLVSLFSGGHNGLPGIAGIGSKKALGIVQQGKRAIADTFEKHKELNILKSLVKLPINDLVHNYIPKINYPTPKSVQRANSFLRKIGFSI